MFRHDRAYRPDTGASHRVEEAHQHGHVGRGQLDTQLVAAHQAHGFVERGNPTVVKVRRGQGDVPLSAP